MLGRRCVYLVALAFSGVFYLLHGEWFSYVLLLILLGLPWLSLLLSLAAIVTFHMEVDCPRRLEMGTPAQVLLMGSSSYPLPPFKGRLGLRDGFTGETSRCYPSELGLPTEHCGCITVTAERGAVCDYLGLFAFPSRLRQPHRILVWPRPMPMADVPDLSRLLAQSWKPKPGGGFAENHELRLYRPGDSLNQVHWKLTAKTGQLTIREPLEPLRKLVRLTLTLNGDRHGLDRKLGRLLWLGSELNSREIPFEIQALTGEGLFSLKVANPQDLQAALDGLLSKPLAAEDAQWEQDSPAAWCFHIGGEPDEA